MANIGMNKRLASLLLFAAVHCCAGFGSRPGTHTLAPSSSHGTCDPRRRHPFPSLHLSGKNDDNGGDDTEKDNADGESERGESYTWEELQADPELRKLEFDSSTNRKNSMLLPQRISQAVTALGWSFVIGGIILNSLGFAWVKDPSGGIGIGTLDERDFQRELMREGRKARNEREEKPNLTISKTQDGNKEYIHSWIERQKGDSLTV
mmetsp:Transcript_24526/g.52015  ORF Transcript_24526/g.52015 Transcript_24526/m.52015 type:complete len:207 (+) Transcript_24526:195-815(+)